MSHPDYLLRDLTSSQIAEWIAYSELEPFGAAELRKICGEICACISNFSGFEKENKTPFTGEDFFPDPIKEREETKESGNKQTVEEMKTVLLGIAAASKKRGN